MSELSTLGEDLKRKTAMKIAIAKYNEAFHQELIYPVADYLLPDFIQIARDNDRPDIARDFETALGLDTNFSAPCLETLRTADRPENVCLN